MKWLAAGLMLLLCACATTPATRPPPRIPLPPPPPAGEPAGFIGLTRAQLRAAYGPPSFTRKEYGAELWRYDTGSCRAFFFMYPAGNDMSVRHVETVPRGQDIAADAACLTSLRAKSASPVS
jgi:hypothetical protein